MYTHTYTRFVSVTPISESDDGGHIAPTYARITVIELDGSDGGGQVVRSALSLSALADEPVRIENVRGARDDPGLKNQHLAAVELAAAICDADVEGAEVDAETLTFDPGPVSGGRYEVDVGTAGSVTLVFDAVLPLAAAIDDPLSITVRGGTDVEWSPPIDYYRRVKLPVLRRHGVDVAVDVERRGFYPAGGGVATLTAGPSDPSPIELTGRGERNGVRIYSVASDDLADADVAERQARGAATALPDEVDVIERTAAYAETASTGSAVALRADYDDVLAGENALGERGVPAERIGEGVARALDEFHAGDAAADRYLADQLLVWLALAGGELTIPEVTNHVESSVELFREFGVGIELEADAEVPRIAVDERLSRR